MKIECFRSYTLSEQCYAVTVSDGIFLVDPGEYTDELRAFTQQNSEKIRLVLLTHRHFDHLLGVADVMRVCPEAKTVIHALDQAALFDPVVSLAHAYKLVQEPVQPDIICKDGDEIPFGASTIRVLHTPGHSAGSVCYILGDVMFCGDTIFYGTYGRVDLPSGDAKAEAQSLLRLYNLPGDYQLYPGHGRTTTLERERQFNDGMADANGMVL